jgi:outer membrane receptor protein involved in Fe transport
VVKLPPSYWVVIGAVLLSAAPALAQPAGSVRGVVYDKDFDAPLPEAQVLIAETGAKMTSTDQGNYMLGQVSPGTYTLVFSKPGYTRQVKANVVVAAGQLTDVNADLSGEFEEMAEFIVQDLQIGGESEMALLNLRMDNPQLMDSISADLMSRAGAGDAAAALNLIPGATVQDGKFAVVRGLPDRYVSSQMNGVRLPTADADKRAVELDQFPAAVIESIQVSKTFTPDQQGDASGGAVNVILKGIADETVFEIGAGTTFNTQVTGNDDFLTYKGGGVNVLGMDDGRDIPDDGMFNGAVGGPAGMRRLISTCR